MSRPQRPGPRGPTLPRELADQIGANGSSKKHRNAMTRKDRRKQERQERKGPRPHQTRRPTNGYTKASPRSASAKNRANKTATPAALPRKGSEEASDIGSENGFSGGDDDMLDETDSDEPVSGVVQREPSPPLTTKLSKTARARLDQDDDEITALERKLGIKKGKKARAPDGEDDGLDDLLGEIDGAVTGEYSTGGKRKLQEDDDWLKQKRRKLEVQERAAEGVEDDFAGFSDDDEQSSVLDDSAVEDDDIDSAGSESLDDEDKDSHVDSVDREDARTEARPQRENPYRAPVTEDQATVAKYIPPSLRKASTGQDESVLRLHRKIQGLINRLSESNLPSILTSIEALYQDNPRGHVTDGLINTLLSLIDSTDTLSDTFIILHAAFIAGLHRSTGPDFLAQLVERIVHVLDSTGYPSSPTIPASPLPVPTRTHSNLLLLLSNLYSFSLLSHPLLLPLLYPLISLFSEPSLALLLHVLRVCGPQLRSSSPASFHDLAARLTARAAEVPREELTARQRFTLETIQELKMGRARGEIGGQGRGEMVGRLKKVLGARGKGRPVEGLGVGLEDVRGGRERGRWWVVGGRWDGRDIEDEGKRKQGPSDNDDDDDDLDMSAEGDDDKSSAKNLLTLARQLGMNTDVRRSVFMAIMAAADYRDAVARITKLALRKTQLGEIARVLVRCATAERQHNPYYALVARDLCGTRREIRMGFQFALWDCFRRMGETVSDEGRDDHDDDDDDNDNDGGQGSMPTHQIVSLAKLFAVLVKNEAVPVTALKKLDFAYLKSKTALFLEVMLTVVILDKGKNGPDAVGILSRAREAEELRVAFRWWVGEVLSKSEVPEKRRHRERVARTCEEVVAKLGEDVALDSLGEESD
ncbi:Suppressor of glycerol defect protein 1 [Sphaceloma murrayae]|uniref:Suppressor of glycerol defect protein 1 n=1 Tax=Sphaceloma murrayae TaxID=2082308 RepID=A0A2K1QZX1_9PEZI|nr:Suppressor of glycerol defect protein 1 [Sphaceloma murrayae]